MYVAGLDLGQSKDSTALCIGERIDPPRGEWIFKVSYLQRWPLGISYVRMAEDLARLLARPPLRDDCTLAIDETGVGRAVGDIFARLGVGLTRVTITAGTQETEPEYGCFHVPKKDLIDGAKVLLEQRRLQVVRSLPEASTLVDELMTYQQATSATGYTSFNAREGKHDDLILAVAIAAWLAGRSGSIFAWGGDDLDDD
jgi:hypothetical protein